MKKKKLETDLTPKEADAILDDLRCAGRDLDEHGQDLSGPTKKLWKLLDDIRGDYLAPEDNTPS
jgi:hypothetical protein